MADEALFIGWGEIVRGRERKAVELFEEAMHYFDSLEKDGRIDGVDAWFLERHGGDLVGYFLLHADGERLDKVRRSADFERLLTRVQLVVDRVGTVNAYTGAALGRLLDDFREATAGLGQQER
ncbi:hypothetical protein [Georgenia sp. SYP-B2076]|uniref:hypothetical protein n=1 Tax=Georgenia sp. SYP-B2076 TaxID=2495881 RepID=UPI000F8E8347|nr:hypothetical protein [Georgenia sp. SYP-B2076]